MKYVIYGCCALFAIHAVRLVCVLLAGPNSAEDASAQIARINLRRRLLGQALRRML